MILAEDLRQAVLQAALQGKLTEQLETDSDVDEMLIIIQKEKKNLFNEKKVREEKEIPILDDEEKPYDVPTNWRWERLGNIGIYKKGPFGSALTKSIFVPKGQNTVKVFEQKNAIQKDSTLGEYYITKEYFDSKMKSFIVESGDIIVSCAGTIGETYIMPNNIELGIINQALMRMNIVPSLNIDYFLMYFDNILKLEAQKGSKGSAIKNIPPFEVFKRMLIPLPPIEEQQRIVDKINEIMPKIDEYEKIEKELEELKKEFPTDMKDAFLQAAMQGKLTEQLENDSSVISIIEQCEKDKEEAIKKGKYKKEKFRGALSEEEYPFDIPDNWKWLHISDMSLFQEGPGILAVDFRTQGVPLIRISGMQEDIVKLDGCNYLDSQMVEDKWKHFKLDLGDIVISTSASMDKIAEVTEETVGAIPYTGLIRFKMYGNINKEYFKYFIKSSFYAMQINEQKSGGTIKHYGPTHLKKMIIPIPPIEEQQRIVERLDAVLPLCEDLEEAYF